MNDYTCPRCRGLKTVREEFDSGLDAPIFDVPCLMCKGTGRLLDRRAKTISDRRRFDPTGTGRRFNEFRHDRRKKI